MSKFNEKLNTSTKSVSYEGGTVYSKSVEDEWANALFSSVMQPQYYESAEEQDQRFVELTRVMLTKYSPELIGKAAVFARNELGMRSISELLAALLNEYSWEGKRKFYAQYFRRPDGVGEVFAALDKLKIKRSHALIRGASDYLSQLDEYQLGKYTMKKHTYNMHDIINLTHAHSEAIDKYQKGILESPETWEVLISTAKSLEDRELAWKDLVENKKLGYLALIRNLKNICACKFATRDWIYDNLVDQIMNSNAIKKSLVWPMQIYTAWKQVNDSGADICIENALSEAFSMSVCNMPSFEGKTLIVLDVSGSMESKFSKNGSLTIKEVCAVYASAFVKSNNLDVDVIKFGSHAQFWKPKFTSNNIFSLIRMLANNDNLGYGTELHKVFDIMYNHYDRVILFSDMQVMNKASFGTFQSNFTLWENYVNRFGNSHMYSFDLGNYRTQVLPSQPMGVSYVTALNDTVFKLIEIQETSKRSLLDIIRDYEV